MDIWKKIISDLISIGVRRFDFSSGESFLYPEFLELISWLKPLAGEININTNGTINVPNVLPYVDNLVFSVHGLGKAHDSVVDKNGSFELLEKNISRTSGAGKKITINMCLIQENHDFLMKVYDYFNSKYDIDKFAPFFPVNSSFGGEYDSCLTVDKPLIKQYISEIRKLNDKKLKLKHGFHGIY